jgi:hypothetical protein
VEVSFVPELLSPKFQIIFEIDPCEIFERFVKQVGEPKQTGSGLKDATGAGLITTGAVTVSPHPWSEITIRVAVEIESEITTHGF